MLNTRNYSLIILDVLLSDRNGHDVIAAIRQVKPMPILVLSENASTADKLLALKSGADDCIDKSSDLEECLVRVQILLRRYTELNHIIQHSYAVASFQR